MKKLLFILIILILTGLGAWFWVTGNNIPIVETVLNNLPFGSEENIQPTTDDQQPFGTDSQTQNEESGIQVSAAGKFIQISNAPVAGFVILKTVRYVDRATGHIYDFNFTTKEKIKITNQTLPKIYEARFKPDGNTVLFRYLKNDSDSVENLSLVLTPPKATSTSLFTITSTFLRGYTGPIVINSPFTNWAFSEGSKTVVYTKPQSDAPGYAYFTTANGGLSKILGPLNGLVVNVNSVGNRILYSYMEDGKTKLFAKNFTGGKVVKILPATLADKCAWSTKDAGSVMCAVPKDGIGMDEPENWYRGNTYFSDRIWLYDTDTEVAELIAESMNLDIYQPKLSPSEDYLVFIDRNDLSLWALKLE
ncbi:MAG: hypothetical protein HYS51_01585 [Candidatus Zambryskibacteria bacterium]|nr:hypothetical protein [Candidatus Zambryskibacteria bacterium]